MQGNRPSQHRMRRLRSSACESPPSRMISADPLLVIFRLPRLQEVLDVEHSDTDAATRRSFKRMLFKKNFATDRANLDSI
jgi:hypothetical protein